LHAARKVTLLAPLMRFTAASCSMGCFMLHGLPHAPSRLLQKPLAQLARRSLHFGSSDTAQARRAVELYLAKASPAASRELHALLEVRGRPPLDALLLDALRGEDMLVPDGQFRDEWVAFATGAQRQHRSTEARRAWAQQDAFGEAAPGLEFMDGSLASSVVADEGVALVRNVIGVATAEALRAFVLAERDDAEEVAESDQAAGTAVLSRVLSPRDSGATETTRWDVRLPWDPVVSGAVREMLAGPLGDAFLQLTGGSSEVGGAADATNDAVLWECAAVVSRLGAAPQIVHGDTTFTPESAMFTAFVALQPVERHQGPTRFLNRTHHGPTGSAAHDALAADPQGLGYCAAAASTVGLLATGDATLYDSRLHHCGGPHVEAPHFLDANPDAPLDLSLLADDDLHDVQPTERVLFYVSFRHPRAASTDNADKHGAGSIRPELAQRHLTLGELRP
tara:strand:- start:1050 stop:2405 length:1356 start_codon:yes stop_codon:yes gene_type:complete